MALKDAHDGAAWNTWAMDLRSRKPAALAQAQSDHAAAVHSHKFNQWLFFRQWSKLKAYANARNIRIVGDIPIFVAMDSSDTWTSPKEFHLDAEFQPMAPDIHARYQRAVHDRYAKGATAGMVRPNYDPALNALQPALDGKLPVAFEADAAREIMRALDMAREFKLDPIITGAGEAHEVADDLKSRNVRVVYNVNYPTRSRTLPADADEPLSALRARANAPKVPAALQKAGVTFAFSGGGLRDPRDFVRNVARAVREGLPADAAIRALTADAAKIAGAGDRLGTLEKGRIANLLVTEGDIFDNAMRVRHVFVDGRTVSIDDAPAPTGGRGGRGGQ